MMKKEIWICLDICKNFQDQADIWIERLMSDFDVDKFSIDESEGVLKITITLNNSLDISVLSGILEDDIVIHGTDYDVITTKADMYELGLG